MYRNVIFDFDRQYQKLVDFVNCHFDLRRCVMYLNQKDLSSGIKILLMLSFHFIELLIDVCFFFPFDVVTIESDDEFITDDIDLSLVFFFFSSICSFDVSDSIDDISSFSSITTCVLECFPNYFEWNELKIFSLFVIFSMDFEKYVFRIRSDHYFLCIFFILRVIISR